MWLQRRSLVVLFSVQDSWALPVCCSMHQHQVLVPLVDVHYRSLFVIEKALGHFFGDTYMHKSFHGLYKQLQEENSLFLSLLTWKMDWDFIILNKPPRGQLHKLTCFYRWWTLWTEYWEICLRQNKCCKCSYIFLHHLWEHMKDKSIKNEKKKKDLLGRVIKKSYLCVHSCLQVHDHTLSSCL